MHDMKTKAIPEMLKISGGTGVCVGKTAAGVVSA